MDLSTSNIVFAFMLTMLAGLSTTIGGFIAVSFKRDNAAFLSISLGFSAGVMIYVSFIEIMPKAVDSLMKVQSATMAEFFSVVGFFLGVALIAIIDKLVPSEVNPHEFSSLDSEDAKKSQFLRMGFFTALAIAIHNFPEGLATFMSALENPAVGISITIAIAIHNIPEGIAVAVPIYKATGKKRKAILYAFLSGMAEPVGATVGFLLLLPFLTPTVFGMIFSLVAGIMVFISIDELLPAAQKFGKHHLSVYGFVAGMAVMAISLLLT